MSTNILDPPEERFASWPWFKAWLSSAFEASKVWKWNKKETSVAYISNQLTDIKWCVLLMTDWGQGIAVGMANAFKVGLIASLVFLKQGFVFLKAFALAMFFGATVGS